MKPAIVHPILILCGGGVALACAIDGELHAEELHGLFAGDTRVLSTYKWSVAGHAWRPIARSWIDASTAQWDMQNPVIPMPGAEIPEGAVYFRVRRRAIGALHDDVTLTSFAHHPLSIELSLHLDADFADVFQVHARSVPPRLGVRRVVSRDGALTLAYERRDFRRGLHVAFVASSGSLRHVGTQVIFDLELEPRRSWQCCVDFVPEIDGEQLSFRGDPHEVEPSAASVAIQCAPLLALPFERGQVDLERLALENGDDPPFIAAGAPWFLALFGRDSLVTSLMAGLLGSGPARGALAALGNTQARDSDDYTDAQPGKIVHELRRGELAHFHVVPHGPYYGSHDAPSLYVLALWNAFRWTGDRDLLERHLPAADAALRWCEQLGDEDRDGLLEYRSRSEEGYRNQGWKDAGNAIPHEDGHDAEPPVATVELQAYWYAARLAMAELRDARGEVKEACRLRRDALRLRALVEERFWLEDAGCYALALDGQKQLVRSMASNPGHLLWCGVPREDRARRVAERLLRDDLFSGYGLRTISATHVRYNPLSYQLGSVWPHDTGLFAAGLLRYGLRDEAARVLEGILEAATAFSQNRLPELFGGFARSWSAPIPYERANVPQGWAAAVPVLVTQLFLGLQPDVPRGRCFLAPWLPEWLPSLAVTGIRIGDGDLAVRLVRKGAATHVEEADHPRLEMIEGAPVAPLWGGVVEEETA
jgi:glycogen debranching enzyme